MLMINFDLVIDYYSNIMEPVAHTLEIVVYAYISILNHSRNILNLNS